MLKYDGADYQIGDTSGFWKRVNIASHIEAINLITTHAKEHYCRNCYTIAENKIVTNLRLTDIHIGWR